jgi:hypothetical protein
MMSVFGTALTEDVAQYHRLIQNQTEPTLAMFFRICFYRLGMVLVVMACVRLTGNYYIFYPAVFLLSLSFGYTLSLLSFCYGLRGVLYMLAYLCPQYFIYIPLLIVVLREISPRMNQAFSPSFRRSMVIFAIILLGCLAESYINPWILKICLIF